MTGGEGRGEVDGVRLAWVRKEALPEGVGWLTDREREALDGLRIEKRRTDWLLGRWAAKLAVQSVLATGCVPAEGSRVAVAAPGVAILPAEDGSPQVHFQSEGGASPSVSVSISHSAGVGFAAAVSGTDPLGCDVEAIEPRSDAFVADYFTDAERQAMAGLSDSEHALLANLVWSAKESALKAMREGLRLDTRQVEVDTADLRVDGAEWSPLVVTGPEERIFMGWWRVREGLVWTVLTEAR